MAVTNAQIAKKLDEVIERLNSVSGQIRQNPPKILKLGEKPEGDGENAD